jgi:hypothetical protein
MLKGMKVLPNLAIAAKALANYTRDPKGKRKATEEPDEDHERKKSLEGELSDEEEYEGEEEQENVHEDFNGNAMQLSKD